MILTLDQVLDALTFDDDDAVVRELQELNVIESQLTHMDCCIRGLKECMNILNPNQEE